ncbi:hypothetical protein BH11ACT4_BH11ACT4_10730 [soil metagenome]
MSTFISEPAAEPRAGSLLPRIAAIAGALFLAIFLALTMGIGGASAADLQCGGVDNIGGQGIDCHVTVVNNLDLNDPTNTFSTVTLTTCTDFAGPVLAGACNGVKTNTTTTSTTLLTAIDQCNGSANGGGGVVYCTVDVYNQITGTSTPPVAATVHECIGSATGAPSAFGCDSFIDPAVAPPAAVNTNPATATVVQCDGSADIDGSVTDCSVSTDSTVAAILPIKVNQCNGSGNGDGGVVVCRTRIRTVIRPTIADTSYTTNTAVFTPLAVSTPGNLAPAPEVIVPTIVVVPVTPPVTGGGGSTGSGNRLVNTGSLAATGTDPMPLALTGLLLLLLGTGVALTARLVPSLRKR